MATFILLSILLLLYATIYVILYIHHPKIHSNTLQMRELEKEAIFPMFLMPSGLLNSLIQLFRKVQVLDSCTKTSVLLSVDRDVNILLDIYEPFAHSNTNTQKKAHPRRVLQCMNFNEYTHQLLMIYSLLESCSKFLVRFTCCYFSTVGGKNFGVLMRKMQFIKKHSHGFIKKSKVSKLLRMMESKRLGSVSYRKLNNSFLFASLRSIFVKREPLNIPMALKNAQDCISPVPFEDNVLLIHGLNGSSKSTYIKGMANTFLERGCRVFCFNVRGAQLPATTNIFNHIGMLEDVEKVVDFILNSYTGYLTIVGFSMGANWVARFLAVNPGLERVKMGVCVCCPFDFQYLNQYLRTGMLQRVVYYGMLLNYKRYLKRSLARPVDFSDCHSIEDIDRKLLRDVYKCKTLEEHYARSSCVFVLDKIETPTLFLSATDDPIIPRHVVPVAMMNRNKNLEFVLVRGGHLGFFNNSKKTAAEKIAGKFFDIHR